MADAKHVHLNCRFLPSVRARNTLKGDIILYSSLFTVYFTSLIIFLLMPDKKIC